MNITLNTLKNIFKLYTDNNKIINDFYFGDLDGLTNENSQFKYPLLAFNPVGTSVNRITGNGLNSMIFEFNIVAADIVNGDKSNMDDVISDAIQNLSDLLSFIDQSEYFNEYNITIGQNNTTMTIFEDEYSDVLAGATMRVFIEVPWTYIPCNIPMIDFEYKDLNC